MERLRGRIFAINLQITNNMDYYRDKTLELWLSCNCMMSAIWVISKPMRIGSLIVTPICCGIENAITYRQ